jgi:hypothetical protein
VFESHSRTSESASLIAARQLADYAHRRRLLADLRRRRRPMIVPPLPGSNSTDVAVD